MEKLKAALDESRAIWYCNDSDRVADTCEARNPGNSCGDSLLFISGGTVRVGIGGCPSRGRRSPQEGLQERGRTKGRAEQTNDFSC